MTDTGLSFVHSRPAANPLVRDYLDGVERAAAHYGGRWDDPARVAELARRVDHSLDRAQVARILRSQSTFAQTAGGEARLERFERQGGFVVTTGQQPVLFGGPLYILYKALTALALAERLEAQLGAPVLPVFWNAGEDHDFDEMAGFGLLDSRGAPARIALESRPGNRVPADSLAPGAEIESVFEAFGTLAPASEFRPALEERLHDCYAPEVSLGRAFSRLIAGWLGGRGLFVVEAACPELRSAAAGLLEREAFGAAESARAFAGQCRVLEEQGYPLQVTPLPGETNLFLVEDGQRQKLLADDGAGFSLKPSGRRISPAELTALLHDSPQSFSPGVLLRPLVESRVFGSLCYVAGPGEISYYAQLGPLYEFHGLTRPVIRPRLSGFVLEGRVRKVLERHALTPEDFREGARPVADRLLAADPALREIMERLGRLGEANAQELKALGPLVGALDPTLKGPLDSTVGAVAAALDRLEKKIAAAARRRDEVLVSGLERAAAGLWPGGQLQERTLATVYFLARYGPDFIEFVAGEAGPAAL